MRRGIFPRIIFLLALTAFSFHGCAGRSIPARPAPPAEPVNAPPAATPPVPTPPAAKPPAAPPVAAPPAEKPVEVSPADRLFSEGMTALREGGHERALELFAAAWKEEPDHAAVAREFDGALLALKKNGDAAFAKGKPEDAGKRWMGTLRYLQHPAAKGKAYPFTRSEVQARIHRLTDGLMEKGLLDYRRGNIESAIAGWKTILAYDPSNVEAAKSLATATTQLEKLKTLPPAPAKK